MNSTFSSTKLRALFAHRSPLQFPYRYKETLQRNWTIRPTDFRAYTLREPRQNIINSRNDFNYETTSAAAAPLWSFNVVATPPAANVFESPSSLVVAHLAQIMRSRQNQRRKINSYCQMHRFNIRLTLIIFVFFSWGTDDVLLHKHTSYNTSLIPPNAARLLNLVFVRVTETVVKKGRRTPPIPPGSRKTSIIATQTKTYRGVKARQIQLKIITEVVRELRTTLYFTGIVLRQIYS